MNRSDDLRLTADGRERLAALHRGRIEAEVRARYADQLAGASLLGRWRIALRIRAEVRRAVDAAAPHAGLY